MLLVSGAALLQLIICQVHAEEYACSVNAGAKSNLNRVATFVVCSQFDSDCDDDTQTVAEIVAASADGNTLVYSNSENESIGFVDITDPASPTGLGEVQVGGEPVSVAVVGENAVVAINTSKSDVKTSGELFVMNIVNRNEVARYELGGRPDDMVVSPDRAYIAITIKNRHRDKISQRLPASFVAVIEPAGGAQDWYISRVSLSGIADRFPDDPEPGYLAINTINIAAVTLQKNNHVVMIDLATAKLFADFSAGTVNIENIDTVEESPFQIRLNSSLTNVAREPHGVTWLTNGYIVTADRGGRKAGARAFSVFDASGKVAFSSGAALEHLAVQLGHYPVSRSANRGIEPEFVEYGVFDGQPLLFVSAERAGLIFVYSVTDPKTPVFLQALPVGVLPEGIVAIPSRNLLVAASAIDSRDNRMRSVLTIYQLQHHTPAHYPSIASACQGGLPIPFGSLSGLAADSNGQVLYSVDDSYYRSNRIFTIDVSDSPATIIAAAELTDNNGVLADVSALELPSGSVKSSHASRVDVFDSADRAAMINRDGTVNIDPEGISTASDGGFWIASEGHGNGSKKRPINSLNMVIKTDVNGVIQSVATLPDEVNSMQSRFGFEGIAEFNGKVYVALQRPWGKEKYPRIGIYNPFDKSWQFVFYPLDKSESPNGGWVGISDLTAIGAGKFLVLERDNQAGPDAAIKRVYEIDLSSTDNMATVSKALVRDLLPDMAVNGRLVFEKIEGMAQDINGTTYIVNDTDGVDGNSGELQLIQF